MDSLPEPVGALVAALGQLPGIGPRSAERLALHLVQTESGQVKQLAEALIAAKDRIGFCQACGALTESQPCSLCVDDRRDGAVLCVVETAVDVINVDKSGVEGIRDALTSFRDAVWKKNKRIKVYYTDRECPCTDKIVTLTDAEGNPIEASN